MAKRLYIITRSDLGPGLQAAQSVHAAIQWCADNPEKDHSYGTVIVLSVPCIHSLNDLWDEMALAHDVSVWFEPDMDDELTAIAMRLEKKYHFLLEHLPLALSK